MVLGVISVEARSLEFGLATERKNLPKLYMKYITRNRERTKMITRSETISEEGMGDIHSSETLSRTLLFLGGGAHVSHHGRRQCHNLFPALVSTPFKIVTAHLSCQKEAERLGRQLCRETGTTCSRTYRQMQATEDIFLYGEELSGSSA